MFPSGRVNNAYDSLNLPRDASMQEVLDRGKQLEARCEKMGDTVRLDAVRESVRIIESVDASAKEQRDMQQLKRKSKSERDLDGQLIHLTRSTGNVVLETEEAKRHKQERQDKPKEEHFKVENSAGESSDIVLFSKLTQLLRDEGKYLRTVNVLLRIISSKPPSSTEFAHLVIDAVEVVVSVKPTGGGNIPLANLTEENRQAVSKLLETIEARDDLEVKEFLPYWTHAIVFRNSFFVLDNFLFAKQCTQLVSIVKRELAIDNDRMLQELLVTISVACSQAKLVPGRLVAGQSMMDEIYKLTRNNTSFFRDGIAKLQKDFR